MLALKNARLIDGTGSEPVEGVTILIEHGRFVSVGKDAPVPAGASVIDLHGKTVIPGLSDAHTHFGGSGDFDRPGFGYRRETYNYAEARESYLRWGVTTVRSCGDIGPEVLSFRDDEQSGKVQSPRVLAVGPWFQAKGGHPAYTVGPQVGLKDQATMDLACIIVDEATDIEAEVARVVAMNVHEIKVFLGHINKGNYPIPVPRITEEQLRRIVAAAHGLGKRVICHVDDPEEMMEAAQCGVDGVEHILGDGATKTEVSQELIDLLLEKHIVVDPTMISILRWDHQVPRSQPVFQYLKAAVKKFYDAGVTLAVGCDSGIPFVPFGESLHDEMSCLVKAGIPELEVLHMATLGNAQVFHRDQDLGSIQPEKRADLVVLDADPLEDIKNTKTILLVMKDGCIVRDQLTGA
jgi:imidazolonepropionase-like amidohydrolase